MNQGHKWVQMMEKKNQRLKSHATVSLNTGNVHHNFGQKMQTTFLAIDTVLL
jgi:hypothetical protein